MHFRTNARRVSAATTATAVFTALTLSGTHADAISVGAGVVLASRLAVTHNVVATLSYDATPFPGGSYVTFNCKALAWVDPASTGLGECSVYGVDAIGSPNNIPGATSAAAGVVFVPDAVERPLACVEGHASFVLGGSLSTGVKCDPLTLVRVAN